MTSTLDIERPAPEYEHAPTTSCCAPTALLEASDEISELWARPWATSPRSSARCVRWCAASHATGGCVGTGGSTRTAVDYELNRLKNDGDERFRKGHAAPDAARPTSDPREDRAMSDESLPYPDPPLGDGRISLRRWRETDVDCIRLAGTDPDIPEGTTVPAAFTPAAGLAFIHRQWNRAENREGVSQAIADAVSDRAVGLVWVALRPQRRVGGLGYWIIPSERGQGLASAAVRLVVPWALDALDLRRLEAWVAPENISSQCVLRNAGFEQEGRLRNFLTIAGRPSDALVFSVVPPG